jgi:hypothetical protein
MPPLPQPACKQAAVWLPAWHPARRPGWVLAGWRRGPARRQCRAALAPPQELMLRRSKLLDATVLYVAERHPGHLPAAVLQQVALMRRRCTAAAHSGGEIAPHHQRRGGAWLLPLQLPQPAAAMCIQPPAGMALGGAAAAAAAGGWWGAPRASSASTPPPFLAQRLRAPAARPGAPAPGALAAAATPSCSSGLQHLQQAPGSPITRAAPRRAACRCSRRAAWTSRRRWRRLWRPRR